jgi:hypothetical protein
MAILARLLERDECATKSEERREDQKARQAAAVDGEPSVEAGDPRHDRQHQQHRQIGEYKQEDTFHRSTVRERGNHCTVTF